jgi:predicted porin
MMNFGATGDTIALVPSMTYKLTNNLSVLGRYLYASFSKYKGSGADGSLQEIDVNLTYSISKNATYRIMYGVLNPSSDFVMDNQGNDNAQVLAHRIDISF